MPVHTHHADSSSLTRFLPWLVLAITLTTTWLLWDHECQATRKVLHAQFDFALRDTVSRVEQRVAAYEQLLRGVQGLFATADLRNRQAVQDYVETLQLDANFSGIQVIGVVERVPSSQKSAHESAIRRLGFPNYAIHPAGEHDVYAPIIQREPSASADLAVLGFDPLTDPVRRLAMEKACDSGMAAITGKVRLAVDKSSEPKAGFIMYLPIFAHGQSRESVEQRRHHLIGWIYASFYMDEFMASLYGKGRPGIALAIYDGADPADAALMYHLGGDTAKQESGSYRMLSANEYMVVGDHSWTFSFKTEPEFEAFPGRDAAFLIAATGIGLSLSLALLSWLMVTGRARALHLAAEMTEELRHAAQHDPLTGLPNRALFSDRLDTELMRAKRQGGRFAVIFLDLDNFKPINDNYGHAVGDALLQQVARRLKDSIRASDTVGRIGGDEFVVLMPAVPGVAVAQELAEKIHLVVRQPFVVEGRELVISCSLGLAVYPDDGGDAISLVKSADEAMYRAKEQRRD